MAPRRRRARVSNAPPPPGRRRPPTKPVTLRMDVELLKRLEHHAPHERRSVGNLMQKLMADGCDRLDDEEAVREVIRNNMMLAATLPPRDSHKVLKRQRAIIERKAGKRSKKPLPPLPPSVTR